MGRLAVGIVPDVKQQGQVRVGRDGGGRPFARNPKPAFKQKCLRLGIGMCEDRAEKPESIQSCFIFQPNLMDYKRISTRNCTYSNLLALPLLKNSPRRPFSLAGQTLGCCKCDSLSTHDHGKCTFLISSNGTADFHLFPLARSIFPRTHTFTEYLKKVKHVDWGEAICPKDTSSGGIASFHCTFTAPRRDWPRS